MRTALLWAIMLLCPMLLVAENGRGQNRGILAAALAASPPSQTVFDQPLSVERIKRKPKKAAPGDKYELSCFHFPGLRVKQLDLGEIGAAELAILPEEARGKRIGCQERKASGEIVIPAKAWSGYFKGAKAGYVLFDAEDGTNGGLGFAVFDGRDGKKLFEDLAVGEFRSAETIESGLRLRYRRASAGSCSVVTEGPKCWSKLVEQMPGVAAEPMPGVAAEPMPECAKGYLEAKREMASGRCEAQRDNSETCGQREMQILDQQHWDQAPSVIAYDVEAEIGRSRQTVRAVGGELSCWPSD